MDFKEIKNKQKRQEKYEKLKMAKKKQKIEKKRRTREEEKATGIKIDKPKPQTLETMRVPDETLVQPDDLEHQNDDAQDEYGSYFRREYTPKVLITSSDRPRNRTKQFCKELARCFPNARSYYRRAIPVKKIVPQAIEKGYSDVIVINEDMKKPNGLLLVHLPNGPTAHFKLSNVKLTSDIKKCGQMTDHQPELVLNNFKTKLGHRVGRMLIALFPHQPNFIGRRVVTFHNQRDFIFFRHHRYQFRSKEKVGLQELGPRFTLKLRSLQNGTFDSKFGEYEWILKRHEMETSRRKFFL